MDVMLSANGWKGIATKNKLKDNGLQKALAAYENLEDGQHDARFKAITSVAQFAATLKKAKEISNLPDVVKYLANVVGAAEAEKGEIAKAKAIADKAQIEAKKHEAQAKQGSEKADDEQEEQGDYKTKLLAAFQKLKGAKELAFQFIVCDAKPHAAIMIAKRIDPKHKEELTKVTGGSKRFLHLGTCQFQDGKFTFAMEKPVSGLARKLQDSIKNFTGKKLPIMVGTETAESDEEQNPSAAATAHPGDSPPPQHALLEKAPAAWHGTRDAIAATINQLKTAIRQAYGSTGPELLGAIERSTGKLDHILEKLDHRLADSLAKAHAAKDPAAREPELKNCKRILGEYIQHVKSEPLASMIAKIDANPFGVSSNLKQVLRERLTVMAQAIGM
jgi:hypothetical protein